MSTYEDTSVAARFAALAPRSLPGDWEEILDRAGGAGRSRRRFAESLHRRHRRHLVVLAAVALVVAGATTSALAVRAYVFHQGIVGLAPVGATPSTPEKGRLVLDFTFGHTPGDPGRFTVRLYADGRLIRQRLGDPTHGNSTPTGWLEQRLTPEGVELVKAEVLATGLVDHDLHLRGVYPLYFGRINLRGGDRVVHVTWGDIGGPYTDMEFPTPEQARALTQLDARLADPESWLPASAREDTEVKPYVPSGYRVCYEGGHGVGLTRVLALLPTPAQDLLRGQESTPGTYTNLAGTFPYWCSDLTNEEARALERILDDAGVHGYKDTFGLTYGAPEPREGATELSLTFDPVLPDD